MNSTDFLNLAEKAIEEARQRQLTKLDLSHSGLLKRRPRQDFTVGKPQEPLIISTGLESEDAKLELKLPKVEGTDQAIQKISQLQFDKHLKSVSLKTTLTEIPSAIKKLPWLETLNLRDTAVQGLSNLSRLKNLRHLYLDETDVSDLRPLAGLAQLELLSLNETDVSSIEPLKGHKRLEFLTLNKTKIRDISAVRDMPRLKGLSIENTLVEDLSPILGATGLLSPSRVQHRLNFADTDATRTDGKLQDISAIPNKTERAQAVFDYLGGGGAPDLPPKEPAPLEVEVQDNRLRKANGGAPQQGAPQKTRAEDAYETLKTFRQEFGQSISVANYRPLATALCAFDRAMGDSYGALHQIGVGMSGDRLSRLSRNTAFLKELPDGADSELESLAAAVVTFSQRFPDWLAYNDEGPEDDLPQEIADNIGEFRDLSRTLRHADDVDQDVKDEFDDETETAAEGQNTAAAKGLLASTRELLRVLSENALIGAKLYRDSLKDKLRHEGKEISKLLPTELRKASIWGVLGVGGDILFNKSAVLLSLSQKFPTALGWLENVLRYLGALT